MRDAHVQDVNRMKKSNRLCTDINHPHNLAANRRHRSLQASIRSRRRQCWGVVASILLIMANSAGFGLKFTSNGSGCDAVPIHVSLSCAQQTFL